VEDAGVERTSDDNRNVFAHAERQDLVDGGLIEKRVAAGDEKAVERACLSEIDQHLIDLSADAGGSDDPLMAQLGENRIGLANCLLDMAHSARKLDDVVDVGDIDALEPDPLPALRQRLPRGRRAIVVHAAQRARRPPLRKVDRFGEGIFRRVGSQESADLGRDDVVAAIVSSERLAKPDFRGPETVVWRRVETSHARRPSRLDDFAPGVILMQGAEKTGTEPKARDLQLRLA
jgi:hypothetical protein